MQTTSLIFDSKMLADYQGRGISLVSIVFASGGCEGVELEIEENPEITPKLEVRTCENTSLGVVAKREDFAKLEGARITKTPKGWIFSSEQVKRRCGCGSSFSFSDEDRIIRDLPDISGLSGAQNTLVDLGETNLSETKEIIIKKGQNFVYRGLIRTHKQSQIRFILEDGAKLDARFLVFAMEGEATVQLETKIIGSDTKANIEYRAFAFDGGKISVNTHVDIDEKLHRVEAGIAGKNIFFSENASISWIPRVSAASDDIRAGHSLSFENLSKIDEFYLMSRGIPERKARKMLAEWHISHIFSDFPTKEYDEIQEYLRKAATTALK